jgi:hypothetical protein
MPDLKILEEAVFGIADNNDTKILVRHRKDDLEETRLYKVVLQNEQVHFVLADSAEAAISQSLCKKGFEYDKEDLLRKTALCMQIPFRIRGWSDREF